MTDPLDTAGVWRHPARSRDEARPLCVHVGIEGSGVSRYLPHLRGHDVVLVETPKTVAALADDSIDLPGSLYRRNRLARQGFVAAVSCEALRDGEAIRATLDAAGLWPGRPKRHAIAVLENHHRAMMATDAIGVALGAPRRYDPAVDLSKAGVHRLCAGLGLPTVPCVELDSLSDEVVAAAHRRLGSPDQVVFKASGSAGGRGIVVAAAGKMLAAAAGLRDLTDYDGAPMRFLLEEAVLPGAGSGRYRESCLLGETDAEGRPRYHAHTKQLMGTRCGVPMWFGEVLRPFAADRPDHAAPARLCDALMAASGVTGSPFFMQFWEEAVPTGRRLLVGEMDPRKRGLDFGMEPILVGTSFPRRAVLRQLRRPWRPPVLRQVSVGLTAMHRDRLPDAVALAGEAFPELRLATEESGPMDEAGRSVNVRLRATGRDGARIEAFLTDLALRQKADDVVLGAF